MLITIQLRQLQKILFLELPSASSGILLHPTLTVAEERVHSYLKLNRENKSFEINDHCIINAVALKPTSTSEPATITSCDFKISANLQEDMRTIASHKLYDY